MLIMVAHVYFLLSIIAFAACSEGRTARNLQSSPNLPDQEMLALNDLYTSTNGAFWRWKVSPRAGAHWDFTAQANPCTEAWQGLNCTLSEDLTEYHVTQIHLPQYNLSGWLPASIGELTQLNTISLDYNHIQLRIPKTIGNLTQLRYVSIVNNELGGNIPYSVGQLTLLQTLLLDNNRLSGNIPIGILNCTSLVHLSLYNNTIHGTIPDNIGALRSLQIIDLGVNDLKGSIPSTIGDLHNLTTLYVNTNFLVGSIPDSVTNLQKLRTLAVYNNFIVGSIPNNIGNMSALTTFTAYFNYLTGTLPPSLGNLTHLQTMQVYDNQINGTVPSSIGDLRRLQTLGLNNNRLRGTVPHSIGNLTLLSRLYLNENLLSGTIPHTLAKLRNIQYLNLYGNRLTGTIPSTLGDLSHMTDLGLDTNLLTSTIPASLGNLTILRSLYVSGNKLTSTIPMELGKLRYLQGLFLYNNELTGTIPNFVSTLTSLHDVELGFNAITGTIPPELGNLHILQYLYLEMSYLSGTIPESVGMLSQLQYLSLANNMLVGTIPRSLSKLVNLREIQLQQNQLSGDINVFNHTTNTLLQTILLASNQLTGTLPSELFTLPQVNTLVVVENCIHGRLPYTICNNTNMKSLILDGLSSARVCRDTVIPGIKASYAITTSVYGTVPPCLFTLPRLNTLHMSGNGFSGTLPATSTISNSLIDVSLSHNKLTGPIPLSIQQRQWYNLDLSYNRLAGSLTPNFASELIIYDPTDIPETGLSVNYSVEASLSLENNRISGNIPVSVMHLSQISILGSNVFSCNLDQSDLPPHDNDKHSYVCGSVAFNIPYYIWLVLLGVCILVVLYVYLFYHSIQHQMTIDTVIAYHKWLQFSHSTQEKKSMLNVFNSVIEVLCNTSTTSAVYIICILLPFYCALSPYYGALTHQYAWGVSGAFLSGLLPAVLEFILLLALLFVTVCVFAKLITPRLRYEAKYKANLAAMNSSGNSTLSRGNTYSTWLSRTTSVFGGSTSTSGSGGGVDRNNTLNRNAATTTTTPTTNSSTTVNTNTIPDSEVLCKKVIIYIIYILVNLFVVIGVNVVYVYVSIYEDSAYHILAQVVLSLFKLVWNSVCTSIVLRSIVSYITDASTIVRDKYSENEFVSLQVIVALVNNIGIPCLVVAVVSPNCFYSVFVPAPKVESVYTYEYCPVFNADTGDCSEYLPAVGASSYNPPYRYNYQCSFSLITFYSPAFVSLCIVATFIAPLAQLLLRYLHSRADKSSYYYHILDFVLPRILKPIAHSAEEAERDSEISKIGFDKTYFKANQVLITILTYLGLLLTFGAMFPPLAVAFVVTIFAWALFARLKVGRFISHALAEQQPLYVRIIEMECQGVGSVTVLQNAMWMLITVSCWFYTLFLFDTLGDSVGFNDAYWVLIVMPLMPVVLYVCFKLYSARIMKQHAVLDRTDSVMYGGDVELQPVPDDASVYGSKDSKFSNSDDVVVVNNVLHKSAQSVEEGVAGDGTGVEDGVAVTERKTRITPDSSDQNEDTTYSVLH